jgi:hypothetical protein
MLADAANVWIEVGQHDLEDKKHSASRYQDNSFFSTSCGLKSRKHQGVSLTLFLWTQRFRLRPRRRDPAAVSGRKKNPSPTLTSVFALYR